MATGGGIDYGSGYGGFDHEFVGESGDEYACGICSKVLRNPHLTVCCGQHYCATCIDHWVGKERQGTCPHCREEGFSHVADKSVRRKVNALQVYCIHKDSGCKWTGELGNLEAHLDYGTGCGYVEVVCSNKCGVPLKRKDLQTHLHDECPQRMYQCKHCGAEDKYETIVSEHYAECLAFPIQCPRGCNVVVKRSELEVHQRQCPMELVQCPYYEEGCDTPLLRKDLPDHLTQSAHEHLSLFVGPFLHVRSRLDAVSTTVDELCARLMVTEGEVRRMEQKLAKTDAEVVKMKEKFDNFIRGLLVVLFGLVALILASGVFGKC